MKIKYFSIVILLNSLFYLNSQDFNSALQTSVLFPFAKISTASNFEDYNFGFNLFSANYKKNFPCQLMIGNLSASGSYSKLNNPQISSNVSPFSNGNTSLQSITACLPGLSTYTKPLGYFAEAAYHNKKSVISDVKINGYYNSELLYPAASTLIKISPSKNFALGTSFTASIFSYQNNDLYYWFNPSNFYFSKGQKLCTNSQFYILVPHFSALANICIFETPFGTLQPVYKIDTNFNFKKISFYLSGFANQKKVISANDTVIPPEMQIKTGIKTKKILGSSSPLLFKTGLGLNLCVKPENESFPFKISPGFQLTGKRFSFSIIPDLNYYIENSSSYTFDFSSAKVTADYSLNSDRISSQFIFSASYKPQKSGNTTSQKLNINLKALKNPKLTSSFNLEATEKDNTTEKIEAGTSIYAAWKLLNINCLGKLIFNYTFFLTY